MHRLAVTLTLLALVSLPIAAANDAAVDVYDAVEHHSVDNDGVDIHYVTLGDGPTVLFVHGFPDFWYTWRHQMAELSGDFKTVAMDTRANNKSGKPEGVENYAMALLLSDVEAVIDDLGEEDVVLVGHDWGGAIAWHFVLTMPQMADKLIIVNMPHPKGIARELAHNAEQRANSQYARRFQKPDSHLLLNAKMLAGFVAKDDQTRAKYIEAFENSSLDGMMNYYRQNYPREPYEESTAKLPSVSVPVLQFHGLKDTALHHHGLNNTWEWVDSDYTLVTIPNANHWAHHDAAELVTDTMKWWLKMRR